MAYAIGIYPEDGLLIISVSDEITGTELMDAIRELRGHPDFSPELDQLWDASRAISVVLTPADMREFIASGETLTGGDEPVTGKQAMVSTKEIYRIAASLYAHQMRRRGLQVEAFKSVEAAAAWMDKTEAVMRRLRELAPDRIGG